MRDGDEKRFGSSTGNRIALCGVAVLVKSTNKKTNKKKSDPTGRPPREGTGRALLAKASRHSSQPARAAKQGSSKEPRQRLPNQP